MKGNKKGKGIKERKEKDLKQKAKIIGEEIKRFKKEMQRKIRRKKRKEGRKA